MKNIYWEEKIDIFDFAFQEIVDVNTGVLYGVEALLRNYKEAGFDSISSVFERAYSENYLYTLDLKLREKAIKKFKTIRFYEDIKLFYNLDNRVLEMPNFTFGNTEEILSEYNVKKTSLCFEISEKHKFNNAAGINNVLTTYKNQGYNIAIDDFGSGFSNLQKLYHIEVDVLKIDRFFINEVEKKMKKRLFLNSIINLVHSLGGIVVAEGVETEEEMDICQKLGCDLVQGYYIHRPTRDVDKINFEHKSLRRNQEIKEYISEDRKIVEANLIHMSPVNIAENMTNILAKLKEEGNADIIPIVDKQNRPLGLISEEGIKSYLLSPYGKEVLMRKNIKELMQKAFVADISVTVDKLIEIFSIDSEVEVVIITKNGEYKGYINKSATIKIISEKKIVEARSQNPLTKLAGNILICDYIEKTLDDLEYSYAYAYFDFNDFKSFNDKYGFKRGDMAIITFSEILKENSTKFNNFIGHIGGDDFFLGIKYFNSENFDDVFLKISRIKNNFEERVKNLYDEEDLARGYIKGQDRRGLKKNIPIMTVSTVILQVPRVRASYEVEEVSSLIFHLKKSAKKIGDSIVCASLVV